MASLNITISPDELPYIEDIMRKSRHIERYRLARQLCHGNVIDIGCGCGYGTYLISKNPDVKRAIGIDPDPHMQAIQADYHYKSDKIGFISDNFTAKSCAHFKPDVAVLIEILEHIINPDEMINLCYNLGIKQIIATVPAYKTTHFNNNHVKDYDIWEFKRLFLSNGYAEILPTIIHNNEVFFGHFMHQCSLG